MLSTSKKRGKVKKLKKRLGHGTGHRANKKSQTSYTERKGLDEGLTCVKGKFVNSAGEDV